MNVRRMLTALMAALVVSGACTYGLSLKVKAKSAAERVPDQHFFAPNRAMDAGEILTADNLEQVNWPANLPLAGAFTKKEELVGRTVLFPVVKDQPLTDKLISAAGVGPGLGTHIPEGMRAISFRSDEVMGVSGFLLPGSHLDMLVTYHSDHMSEPATATVLQDVTVLAAGKQLQPDPNSKEPAPTVLTLLMTPADAEKAVMASTQGTIHFVMRRSTDRDKVEAPPILLSQISGIAPARTMQAAPSFKVPSLSPVEPVQPVRSAPREDATSHSDTTGYTVETLMGDKASHDSFPHETKR